MVPDRYGDIPSYVATMQTAVVQEMNRALGCVAQRFFKVAVGKVSEGMRRHARSVGVPLYLKCELVQHFPASAFRPAFKGPFGHKRRGHDGYDDEEADPRGGGTSSTPEALYLKIDGVEAEASADYAKEDLWIISTTADFDAPTVPEGVGPGGRRPDGFGERVANLNRGRALASTTQGPSFTFVARGVYHGRSSRGLIELKASLPFAGLPFLSSSKVVPVFAIRGPNVSSEVAALMVLHDLTPRIFPLGPVLLGGRGGIPAFASAEADEEAKGSFPALPATEDEVDVPASCNPAVFRLHMTRDEMETAKDKVVARFNLNEDQVAVLDHALSWFRAEDDPVSPPPASPVCLVHGVFGSGKSHLLVACVTLLSELLAEGPPCSPARKPQILIASATNVAVDGILLGLLASGFTDFCRVGSVKKIAKPLLSLVAHSQGTERARAVSDLKFMLTSTTLSAADRTAISTALAKLEHEKDQADALITRRVVGVTCAATSFGILEGRAFPIVLLDEASQMTEPTSLVTVGRFFARRLLAVGDPLQLPPTLTSSPASQGQDSEGGEGSAQTLERTLFERLATLDITPVMLRTQYRCHPQFSALSSKFFYNDRLRDGVTPEQRPPLLPDVPALVFFDVTGAEKESGGGSVYNDVEASVVCDLVAHLLRCGFDCRQIGVICLYKAQAAHCLQRLRGMGPGTGPGQGPASVQVSTVDAFQGAERDVIIVSTVRTQRLGFITSPRRLNVTLTRARNHLFVCGNRAALSQHTVWRAVIASAGTAPGGIRGTLSRPLLPDVPVRGRGGAHGSSGPTSEVDHEGFTVEDSLPSDIEDAED